jgi:hypothetical protein
VMARTQALRAPGIGSQLARVHETDGTPAVPSV